MPKILPDKPSDLIELALRDLELCEVDPRYQIAMEFVWHKPSKEVPRHCTVCLAGSVMAQTFKADYGTEKTPNNFGDHQKLYALNTLRRGLLKDGLSLLDVDVNVLKRSDIPSEMPITPYKNNPTQFKADMRAMAQICRKVGL